MEWFLRPLLDCFTGIDQTWIQQTCWLCPCPLESGPWPTFSPSASFRQLPNILRNNDLLKWHIAQGNWQIDLHKFVYEYLSKLFFSFFAHIFEIETNVVIALSFVISQLYSLKIGLELQLVTLTFPYTAWAYVRSWPGARQKCGRKKCRRKKCRRKNVERKKCRRKIR